MYIHLLKVYVCGCISAHKADFPLNPTPTLCITKQSWSSWNRFLSEKAILEDKLCSLGRAANSTWQQLVWNKVSWNIRYVDTRSSTPADLACKNQGKCCPDFFFRTSDNNKQTSSLLLLLVYPSFFGTIDRHTVSLRWQEVYLWQNYVLFSHNLIFWFRLQYIFIMYLSRPKLNSK